MGSPCREGGREIPWTFGRGWGREKSGFGWNVPGCEAEVDGAIAETAGEGVGGAEVWAEDWVADEGEGEFRGYVFDDGFRG